MKFVGKLYAVGGLVCGVGVHSGAPFRYCDNGCESFDPETGHWSRVQPMNQCRSNHSVQPLGKKVILNEFSVVDNTKSFLFRARVECFSQQSFFQRNGICLLTSISKFPSTG